MKWWALAIVRGVFWGFILVSAMCVMTAIISRAPALWDAAIWFLLAAWITYDMNRESWK